MESLKGIVLLLLLLLLLLLVLVGFTAFSLKMPKGMKAMGALAGAATASFLVEAFHFYVGGDLFGITILRDLGAASGGMGGVAAATLVALALGSSPVYAVLIGCAVSGFGILPGFFAGYVLGFVLPKMEEKIPDGIDLIAVIVIAALLARLVAIGADPLVNATLINIGKIITQATAQSPTIMAIILGGVITVVATAPLSSMALTAMLGLTGLPMAIGALAVMGSSFMNGVFFHKIFKDKSTTIAVAVEPLTQADLISANPIPVYCTNFVSGAIAGLIVTHFGLINNAAGTATPIAGLMVMYGFNSPLKVTMAASLCAVSGLTIGYIGSLIFKNFKIKSVAEVRGTV
ncbi:MAG: transcriptional regulator [Fusobacteriia bacterium 4572_74]|nr:MAG: transcriptional regulator [Fusobacteriia bacterium 4572_74]